LSAWRAPVRRSVFRGGYKRDRSSNENVIDSGAKLAEPVRLLISEALQIYIPAVIGLALSELEARIMPGYSNDLAVRFYRTRHECFGRALL
jgi:hypothetical protein